MLNLQNPTSSSFCIFTHAIKLQIIRKKATTSRCDDLRVEGTVTGKLLNPQRLLLARIWIHPYSRHPPCFRTTVKSARMRTRRSGWPLPSTASGRPAPTHLLSMLRERVGHPHHHAGAGILVLRQVNAGHPLQRKQRVSARPPNRLTLPPDRERS